MPLLDPDDYTAPSAPVPVQIAKPTFRGNTVDNEVYDASKLLTQIEGKPWTVTYFSQIIGADNSVGGQGLGTPGGQQQYRQIRNLEIRVTSDLQASQDTQSGSMNYVGSAVMFPFIVPNAGDMFVADVNDGRMAIFQINQPPVRKSIYRGSSFEIEYQAIDFIKTLDDARYADLQEKVVEKFEFVRDFITYGQNPLLFESEFEDLQFLRRNYRQILDTYLKSYYSRELDTVLVPGQTFKTYDPYLMAALIGFFETSDGSTMRTARQLNVDDDQASRAVQLWEVLLKRDMQLMSSAFTQVGLVSVNTYSWEPQYDGIRYSGVEQVIYPVDAMLTVDYNTIPTPKLVSSTPIEMGPQNLSMAQYLLEHPPIIADSLQDPPAEDPPADPPQPPDGEFSGSIVASATTVVGSFWPLAGQQIIVPPVIHTAMTDGYYVLSKAFYERDRTPGSMSQIELMVWDFLEDKKASFRSLRALSSDVRNWSALDKFYLVPVLLVLIRNAIRGI